MADDEPRPYPVPVIPDDARELDRDVAALHRERRAAHRRQRLAALLLTRHWYRYGLSGPLVVAILLLVALVGALPIVLHPSSPRRTGAQPLASPAVPAGRVGGLLPDGPVTTPAGRTTIRELARPGVLVLVPVPCGGCEGAVSRVVEAALEVTRGVRLLSTGSQDPTGEAAAALRTGAARGLATSGVDEQGVLAAAYAARGVTAVFVAPNGVVSDVVHDVRAGQRLDAEVGRLQVLSR